MADTKVNVAPAAPPKKPDLRFVPLCVNVLKMVARLDEFPLFFFKYALLQLLRLVTALSFVVVAFIMADKLDIDNITTGQYVVLGCLGLVNILGRLAPFGTKIIVDNLKEGLQATQATTVLEKIFDLPHNAMLSTPTGEFVQLISKIFRNLDQLLPAIFGAVVPVAVEVFVAVIFLGIAYGPIALVQLALYVVYTITSYKNAAKKAERNKQMVTAMLSEWGKILAVAGSYERAHLNNRVNTEVAAGRKSFETIGHKMVAVMRGEHWEAMGMTAVSLVVTIVFFLILPVTTSSDVEGIELAALAFYFLTFVSSLEQYAVGVSNLRTAVTEYQLLIEFQERLSDVGDIPGAVDIPMNPNPSIEFKNVSFRYTADGPVILDDVSFKVESGTTLGLVGSSGCGKSTIMRLLLRFYRPTTGTIIIDGHNIKDVTALSLRRLFSVVTQDAALFHGTIRENIEYAKAGASDDEVMKAASLAELPLNAEGSDLTLDKNVGEKGAKLSGGQQQRVALARAMLKNGTVYLLDEPTTGLDGATSKALQATLDKLASNATTLTITHHLDDLRQANNIVYLEKGHIVESGTYRELVEAGGEFARQVGARAGTATATTADVSVEVDAGAGAGAGVSSAAGDEPEEKRE